MMRIMMRHNFNYYESLYSIDNTDTFMASNNGIYKFKSFYKFPNRIQTNKNIKLFENILT